LWRSPLAGASEHKVFDPPPKEGRPGFYNAEIFRLPTEARYSFLTTNIRGF
jgi:hypothetical protein